MKTCLKCGTPKKNSRCPACRKEYLKLYASNNLHKYRKYGKEWRMNNVIHEKVRHLEYRLQNADSIKHSIAQWAKRNPDKRAAKGARYRASKLQATPAWANRFFIDEIYHLAQLRSKATGMAWEVDHIVPLQSKVVCGLHVENNLQVIPVTANRRKSNTVWPNMPN